MQHALRAAGLRLRRVSSRAARARQGKTKEERQLGIQPSCLS